MRAARLRKCHTRLGAAATLAKVAIFTYAALIPLETLEVSDSFSVAQVGGIALVAAGIVAVVALGRLRPVPTAFWPFIGFALWSGLSIVYSVSPEQSILRALTLMKLAGMSMLLYQLTSDPNNLEALYNGYMLGCLAPSIRTLVDFFGDRPITTVGYYRYAGLGADPNDLSLTLILALPLAYRFALRRRTKWASLMAMCYWLLVATVIILTGSRTGAVTGGLVACWMMLSTSRLGVPTRLGISLAIVLVGVGLTLVTNADKLPLNRFATIFNELEAGGPENRRMIWSAALEAFQERPILGIGSGSFPMVLPAVNGRATVAHNTWLSVAVETGIIGLALFSVGWLSVGMVLRRMARGERQFLIPIALAWLIGVQTLTWEYRKATWLVVVVILSSRGLRQWNRAQGARQVYACEAGRVLRGQMQSAKSNPFQTPESVWGRPGGARHF